ncbi:MAG: hypothetical protein HY062_09750 [Bacteroidetes bacterium]|nr:hypothetical protein [Bacteroidota bacterium]
MSDEENNMPKNDNPTPLNTPEEERKKQFEKMKDRFGKKPTNPFGGSNSGGNGGNSFYWIYGLVIVGLLIFVFFGQDFEGKIYEVDETYFEQNMLAKGDVKDIVIVNEKVAEITINQDSLKLPRYSALDKTGKSVPFFPDPKSARGPHFKVSIPDVKDFLEQVRSVQNTANLPIAIRVSPSRQDRTEWSDHLGWMLPIAIMVILWPYWLALREQVKPC